MALPTRHLSTIHAAQDDDGAGDFQRLDPASPAELEGLDASWETVAGTPTHWTQGHQGLETLRSYPVSADNRDARLVYHEHLAAIPKGPATLTLPEVLRQYFFYAVLGEARRQEGEEAMPEVAEYCGERVRLLESVFGEYWGAVQ